MSKYWRILLLCLSLASAGCVTAPFDYPRESSTAISPDEDTSLRATVSAWTAENPGPSGFYPLVRGSEGLGARLRLIERAEKTIDAQYFLMKGDTAGKVFAGSLLAAADRGVRVRFLLDDVFTTVGDEELELIDAHPNIEVRLYNPVSRFGIKSLNFLFDFWRANRRMHNKSFTVDNQVSIVGGRNIADEYFELKPEGEFMDFDVIALGPIAADVSEQFDNFWNHERSLPIKAFRSRFDEEDLQQAREDIDKEMGDLGASVYRDASETELIVDLVSGKRNLFSAPAEVITDDPEKLVSKKGMEQMILIQELAKALQEAEEEVLVVTPYFVPGKAGVEFWRSIVDKGVRVLILTNSLASTNHTAVHSGYAGYRKRVLDAGVELYEARANAVDAASAGNSDAEALTLHTKAMLIDGKRLFVGSLNLDPRSREINSEMGLLVDSEEMGEQLANRLLAALPELAYRVERDERGRLQWRGQIDGVEVIETSEPLASRWLRFKAFLLKIVPNSQL